MKGRVWDIPARMIWGLVIVELRTPRAPCRWGPRVPLFLLRRFWATTAAWLPGYLGDRGACRLSLGVGISRNTAQLQNALLLGTKMMGTPELSPGLRLRLESPAFGRAAGMPAVAWRCRKSALGPGAVGASGGSGGWATGARATAIEMNHHDLIREGCSPLSVQSRVTRTECLYSFGRAPPRPRRRMGCWYTQRPAAQVAQYVPSRGGRFVLRRLEGG